MTVLHIEDVDRLGIAGVVEKARAVVGDGPTYISFDVDGLDPAYTPGTGTPEAGGLTPREAQAILHGLKGLDIIGGDVVEVAPQYDATTNTAMVGAQMLFEIFSLLVLGPTFKRRDLNRLGRQQIPDLFEQYLAPGRRRGCGLGPPIDPRQCLDQPEHGKGDDDELNDGVDEDADVEGHRPRFLRLGQGRRVRPLQGHEDVAEIDAADGEAVTGVRMSLTRLLTTPVKATPMMMPTARSTTLPRMMKARNSPIQPGWRRRSGDAVRSLIDPSL